MTVPGVAVFAYNRPEHLQQVLDALKDNNVKHIYIFIDGARNEDDRKKVRKVKKIANNVDWCNKTIHAQEENIGLAQSITTGVNRVFEDHDRIIVLEDDCVPASNFISYMSCCLNKYEDNNRVMNVSGYSPPINIPDSYPYDVYFTHRSSSWGWGTWKSAWEHFDQDPMTLQELNSRENEIKEVTDKAGTDIYSMMYDQAKGNIDSWAVWWSYAIAFENGVCVNPVKSKVKNIGHDGSGTHTGNSEKYRTDLSNIPVSQMNIPKHASVDNTINKRYNEYMSGSSDHILNKYVKRVLKSVGLWKLSKYLS